MSMRRNVGAAVSDRHGMQYSPARVQGGQQSVDGDLAERAAVPGLATSG